MLFSFFFFQMHSSQWVQNVAHWKSYSVIYELVFFLVHWRFIQPHPLYTQWWTHSTSLMIRKCIEVCFPSFPFIRRSISSIRGELLPYLVRKQFSKTTISHKIKEDAEDQSQKMSDSSTNQGQSSHRPIITGNTTLNSHSAVTHLKQLWILFISVNMENI